MSQFRDAPELLPETRQGKPFNDFFRPAEKPLEMVGPDGRVTSFSNPNYWTYGQFFKSYKRDPVLGRSEQRFSWVTDALTKPQEIWRRPDTPRNSELFLVRYRIQDKRRVLYIIDCRLSIVADSRLVLEPWREIILPSDEEAREWKRLISRAKLVWHPSGLSATSVGTGPTLVLASVLEAVDLAATDFANTLRVWRSARSSAADSCFTRPVEVYDALRVMADLSKQYFADEAAPVGPWDALFAQHGMKYSPFDSQTTETMFSQERTFLSPEGVKTKMCKHLTLGGGDRANCIQIYFDCNEQLKRFDVGYCGIHLPYARQRT